jgi:hypothetical protein
MAGFPEAGSNHWESGPCGGCSFGLLRVTPFERDLAPAFVATDGFTGGDSVVMAEQDDMEVMGSHTLESLGVTVDPVAKKLVPAVGLALTAISDI